MSTPFLLASVVLLAGVAARPVHTEKTDDLAEMARSSSGGDTQAFLGRVPSESEPFNSLQLHDLNDITEPRASDDALAGSASPKLKGSVPDPGLQSPYFTAQRHLSLVNAELPDSFSLSPKSPKTAAEHDESSKEDRIHPAPSRQPEYSPIVVYLVAACAASLVLLGLAVVVVRISRLYYQVILQNPVWQAVSHRRGKTNGGVATSEKGRVSGRDSKLILGEEGKHGTVIAAREIPASVLSSELAASLSEKDGSTNEDPPEMPLPEAPMLIRREESSGPGLVVVLKAWTLDNWVTHFMVALFGWIGVLLGSGQQRQ